MKHLVRFLVTLLTLSLPALAGPYDAWMNFRAIHINTTATGGGANVDAAQNNFPLLVRLTNASAATGANVLSGSLTAGGLDVRFTDVTGEIALPFEIERWSPSAAEFWVRVPVVAALGNTIIRMYWGMAGQSNASNGPAVFDTSIFAGVWHMNGADSASDENDATANGLTAVQQGRPGSVAGLIGPTRHLDTTGNGTAGTRVTLSTATGLGFTPNAISFPNPLTGYAVGNGGAISKTTNRGANWATQTSTTAENLRSVYFMGPNFGFAVGGNGTILRTVNGGTTWAAASKDVGTSATINGVTTVGPRQDILVAVGDAGVAYRSIDSGANWTQTASLGASTNWKAVTTAYGTTVGVVTAVGDSAGRGVFARMTTPLTSDVWTRSAITSASLHAVAFAYATNAVVAVGDSGHIRRIVTTTVTTIANPAGINTLRAVYAEPGMVYAVGDSGKIFRSINFGSAFTNQVTGTTENLTGISAFYAMGAANTVARLDNYKYFTVAGSSVHPSTLWSLGFQYSVAAWVRATNVAQRAMIHKGEFSGGLSMSGAGLSELVEYRGTTSVPAPTPTGWSGRNFAGANVAADTWQHLFAARDGEATAVRTYSNGVVPPSAADVASAGTNLRATHNDIYFGRLQNVVGVPRLWHGELDEIQVYKIAVTENWARLTHATQNAAQTAVTLGGTNVGVSPGAQRAAAALLSMKTLGNGLLFQVNGSAVAQKANFTLVDTWGRTVWNRTVDLRVSNQAFWDGQKAATGVYLMRVSVTGANGQLLQTQERKVTFTR